MYQLPQLILNEFIEILSILSSSFICYRMLSRLEKTIEIL